MLNIAVNRSLEKAGCQCQGCLNSAPKDFLPLAMSRVPLHLELPIGIDVKPLPLKGIKPNDDAWQPRALIRAR